MRDQLAAGLVLAAAALGAALAGFGWLAVAALVAALPFLVIGIALAAGELDARGERPQGTP